MKEMQAELDALRHEVESLRRHLESGRQTLDDTIEQMLANISAGRVDPMASRRPDAPHTFYISGVASFQARAPYGRCACGRALSDGRVTRCVSCARRGQMAGRKRRKTRVNSL